MNMIKKIKSNNFLRAVSVLLLMSATVTTAQEKDNRFEVSKNLDIFNAVVKEMEMFYVDSVDVEKQVRIGVNAMLGSLDPYTEYYPEQDMDVLKLMTTGEYGGIGSVITQRDGGVYINEPYAGMPAAEADLRAGDHLLAIDGIDVSTKTSQEVSDLLKGQPNTKLTIKFKRPGVKKPMEVEITRKLVVIDQVTYYGMRNDSVGYISLKSFTDKSAQEVKQAFEDLKKNHGMKSLILDLRGNGGGLLDAAVQITNYFVPKGEVVLTTKGKIKQWDRTYRTANEPIDTVMPIAVLIDNNSASASEIVSGALQDLDRAVLVGQRTFGKGLVQSTRDIPYGGNVKVTISKYYIPSGRCIQAIDYTHKNADGSVGRIPDSLTTVFNTAKGRLVRDGGGVSPEFEVKAPKIPTMMYYMMGEYVVFDFVTEWMRDHKTIASADEFVFPEVDYESFKTFVKGKDFKYDRQSEKVLKNLKEVAEFEGYMTDASAEYKALEAKLTPNLDRDLDRFRSELTRMIAGEIVKRYHFQRGEMIQNLKEDKVLDKAIEVLGDKTQYDEALRVKEIETPKASDEKKETKEK